MPEVGYGPSSSGFTTRGPGTRFRPSACKSPRLRKCRPEPPWSALRRDRDRRPGAGCSRTRRARSRCASACRLEVCGRHEAQRLRPVRRHREHIAREARRRQSERRQRNGGRRCRDARRGRRTAARRAVVGDGHREPSRPCRPRARRGVARQGLRAVASTSSSWMLPVNSCEISLPTTLPRSRRSASSVPGDRVERGAVTTRLFVPLGCSARSPRATPSGLIR